jgi:uncharacterized lipoprotein
MKRTLLIFTSAVALLSGCVTDNVKFPTPTANFMPKRVYSVPHDKVWQAVLDALDKNNIAVVESDKSSGIIQTDYIAGPSGVMIPLGISQSTRYKYNVSLRDESDGSVKVKVICKIEDTMSNGHDSTQWHDATSQNAALEDKLETWLYEQIEQGL